MAFMERTRICAICNRSGAYVECTTCPRDYHEDCFSKVVEDLTTEVKQCSFCIKYGNKAIQVVEFVKNEDQVVPILHIQRIRKIIEDSEAEDLPIVIVSVAGVARSGKSFLLSVLMDRVRHQLEENELDWAEAEEGQIAGFIWSQSIKAVTFGMWMWERAFITRLEDGTKVAIIYMDTQGTSDRTESTNAQIDTLIMYLSLEISAIQIHNIDKIWRVEEARIYEVCTLYAEKLSNAELGKKPFNSLVILYRNWQADREHGNRSNYLEKLKKDEQDPKALATLNGIEASFDSVEFAMLPQPGEEVLYGDLIIAKKDIGKRFLKSFESFFKHIFSPSSSLQDNMKSCRTGNDIIKILEELQERLGREDLPMIKSAADHVVDSLNNHLYNRVMADFTLNLEKVRNLHEGKFADVRMEDLHKELEELSDVALKDFKQKVAKTNQSDISYMFYLEKLRVKMDKKKNDVKDLVKFVGITTALNDEKLKNIFETEIKRSLISWDDRVGKLNMKCEMSSYKKDLEKITHETCKEFHDFTLRQASEASSSSILNIPILGKLWKKFSFNTSKQPSKIFINSQKDELKKRLTKMEEGKVQYFEFVQTKENLEKELTVIKATEEAAKILQRKEEVERAALNNKLENLLLMIKEQGDSAQVMKEQQDADKRALQEEMNQCNAKREQLQSELSAAHEKIEELSKQITEESPRQKESTCQIL